MKRLEGKVALVTGAARGQGAAEVTLFAEEGATVIVADILDDLGQRVAEQVENAAYCHLDVTSPEQWRDAVAMAEDRYGSLDILVNNAGIAFRRPADQITLDEWRHVMAVNLDGVWIGTKAVVPAMRRAGGGSIVNIASTAGIHGVARSAAYSASKGGVRLFTKSAAKLYGPDGIRCNAVNPGVIMTDMQQMLKDDEAERLRREAEIPLGRIGTSQDVAYAVLFLASDEAAYITGADLALDGGMTS
jgi:3alpha(or 20beta)-hydroxysteroid dehydrogenase